jgi:hypothetical protein
MPLVPVSSVRIGVPAIDEAGGIATKLEISFSSGVLSTLFPLFLSDMATTLQSKLMPLQA